MQSLDLESDDYDGTYKLIGGRPVLDFVNTVSWPHTDRRHDWLSSPANLDRWCEASGLATSPATDNDGLEQARDLRTDLTAAVRPLAFDDRPAEDAIEVLNARLAVAHTLRRVDPTALAWAWRAPASVVDRLAPVVFDAAELVVNVDHGRLRHCDACDWLFEDQSRNGRRRWCDMADCGSRAKSRSYYHRTKATSI